MSTTKIEFAVQMKCDSCVKAVEKSLSNLVGIKNVNIDLKRNTVIVDTTLSTEDVKKKIESTGRKVVVKGLDGNLAAVSIIDTGTKNVQGVVRFTQLNNNLCVIDGTIDGLKPTTHKISIHECGDLSQGCSNVGDCYNPNNTKDRVYGDLGNIVVEENGRSTFRIEDDIIKLSDIIGRSLVISEIYKEGAKNISCGVIARSSGLFQNPKTICACDGVSIWDEKNKPASNL